MKKLLLKFAHYILRKYNSVVPVEMGAPILFRGKYFAIHSIEHYMEYPVGGKIKIVAVDLVEVLENGGDR